MAIKRAALQGINLHVVAPSRWMLDRARGSPAFEKAQSFRRIPTGIDTETFRPRDKAGARAMFELPKEEVLVLIGSPRLDNDRKGLDHALAALTQVNTNQPIRLVCFGAGLPEARIPDDLPVTSLGYVDDPARLAAVYAAADMFLLPSLEDNLPKTGLEALACGTPVVGFAAGGVPDFITPGETGLTARTGDVDDLARQITWMIDHEAERAAMGSAARERTLEEFTASGQALAYRDLYDGIGSPFQSSTAR